MQPLTIGQQAPDFTLFDQDNQPIELRSFLGHKVLIYFYPKAMTPGCTVQARGLRDQYTVLQQYDIKVLGISPDSPERLKRFQQKEQLNFKLLSDEDHQLAEQFGVWGNKKFMGKSFDGIHRISFLLDEKGIVIQRFDKFKTNNHAAMVIDYLAQLR